MLHSCEKLDDDTVSEYCCVMMECGVAYQELHRRNVLSNCWVFIRAFTVSHTRRRADSQGVKCIKCKAIFYAWPSSDRLCSDSHPLFERPIKWTDSGWMSVVWMHAAPAPPSLFPNDGMPCTFLPEEGGHTSKADMALADEETVQHSNEDSQLLSKLHNEELDPTFEETEITSFYWI